MLKQNRPKIDLIESSNQPQISAVVCECQSERVTKAGKTWKSRKKVQRWRCTSCGRIFTEGAYWDKDINK